MTNSNRHHLRTAITRTAAAVATLCLLAPIAACTTSEDDAGSSPSTATSSTAGDFSGLVDIGDGRQLWTTCKGQGSPTVMLLSGHGNGAEDWSLVLDPDDPAHDAPGDDVSAGMGKIVPSDDAVLPSVARFTRVCSYDRPNIRTDGEVSTPREQPHTVDPDVEDLHALLEALDETEPVVLAAHSYGGLIASLYARTYPDDVAGLVMVDTVSEAMERLVSPGALDWWDRVNAETNEVVMEGVRIKDAFAQINAAGPMPDVPSIVLMADKPFRTDLVPPEQLAGEHTTFEDWQAMVLALAEDLGAKRTVTETNSGHNIYMYSPDLVIDAIREIVDDARVRGDGPFDEATTARVDDVVDRFVETNRTPGALIGVWSPQGTYVAARGVSDVSTGAPLEPDMQFKIASQTKSFTANLVLQLVGEGSVGLDDHISKWIDGVPNGDRITIRQLLNHTSGLADGFTSPGIQGKVLTGCTVDELLEEERKFDPVAEPGEKWSYSNYGYNLLGRVVELVTGQDLSTALQERIAEPLGLRRTALPTSGSGLTEPFSHGYGTGDLGPTQAPTVADDATDLPASCLWAHGGMVSTLEDMRKWAVALGTGSLLTPEVWKEATSDMIPFVFDGHYNGPGQWRYGLGFVETGGFYGAEGSFAGYESATMHSPALGTTIAVASMKMPNAITPPPMLQALAMAVHGDDVDFGLTTDQALEPNLGALPEAGDPDAPTTAPARS